MLKSITTSFDDSHHQQNRKVFRIYNIYRLTLALILFAGFYLTESFSALGASNESLFVRALSAYLVFNALVIIIGLIPKKTNLEISEFIAVIIIDIILLTLISYTCGGVSSGMAHMLIVPVAAGGILFQSRMSAFFAAVGTLSAIYSELYLFFTLDQGEEFYFQVGLLGLTLFIISLVLQYFGRKIRQNELLAKQQAESIQSLEEMNYQIIQRMRTGIIVVDDDDNIVNINHSAIKLLEQDTNSNQQYSLPEVMKTQLKKWKATRDNTAPPFRISKTSPQLQARFSFLQPEDKADILIVLEDYTWLSSRAQHLKLMSLGRLTASIAHEVRNPLGAISHASQLLKESENIPDNDQRMLDIIDTHTKRVNAIIENILELSRSRDKELEDIRLQDWLNDFIARFTSTHNAPVQIDINCESPEASVRFNRSQLEQVCTNLFENGLRYSLKNTGRAALKIHTHSNPHTQSPVMDIMDYGTGVAEEIEDQIFEPFFTTEHSGTGLGLFICKEICEANMAYLSYFRTDDKLTCFRISFTHPDHNII